MSCHLFEIWSYYNSDSFSSLLSLNIFYFEKKICKTVWFINSRMINVKINLVWKVLLLSQWIGSLFIAKFIWLIIILIRVSVCKSISKLQYIFSIWISYLILIISYRMKNCIAITVYIQTPHVHLVTFMGGNIVTFYMSRSRL